MGDPHFLISLKRNYQRRLGEYEVIERDLRNPTLDVAEKFAKVLGGKPDMFQ